MIVFWEKTLYRMSILTTKRGSVYRKCRENPDKSNRNFLKIKKLEYQDLHQHSQGQKQFKQPSLWPDVDDDFLCLVSNLLSQPDFSRSKLRSSSHTASIFPSRFQPRKASWWINPFSQHLLPTSPPQKKKSAFTLVPYHVRKKFPNHKSTRAECQSQRSGFALASRC